MAINELSAKAPISMRESNNLMQGPRKISYIHLKPTPYKEFLMFFFAVAFLLGDLFLQSVSQLPQDKFIYLSIMVSIFLWIFLRKYRRYIYLLFVFFFGFLWTAWYAKTLMSVTLPKEMEGKNQFIIGYIASLPQYAKGQTQFLFATNKILIRLMWRSNNKKLKVGDKWQLHVRLKKIHGTQNPGAFDYDAWALQKGLRATGYVVANSQNILLSHAWYRYPLDHFRQKFQEKIQLYLPISRTAPWLMALILGERNNIAAENWQVLRNTGTNHLMAVGGLHIGILAAMTQFIFTWLWRSIPKGMLIFPAHLVGACVALLMAILYSALAGFSIPTQRACIMLTVYILALIIRRKVNAWQAWGLALLCVLIINPLSVLNESVWLSFMTIGLIVYGMSGRLAPRGWWWKWGRVQWVIGWGLIPLSLLFFQQCSLISFIANTIAIPWLGLLVLPFCFLSGIFLWISPVVGHLLLVIADESLSILWIILTWLSQVHFAVWQQSLPDYGVFIITLIGCLLLLLPMGTPGRWLSLFWLMPLIFLKPCLPNIGDYRLTLLDVGQGLSVVVQTHSHLIVFDTGANYATVNMGERVLLPYLHTLTAKKIDLLVLSHGDNDHIGGAQALLHALPILSIKTSVPNKFPLRQTSACQAGDAWQWDQVNFIFLHPTASKSDLGNNSSCVLRIDNGTQRVLLTGDIEKYAEKDLLARLPEKLPVDILIAPHHGSKTSGLKVFIDAVHPRWVLYAIGYRNRYHFPHPSIVEAYNKINTVQLDTAISGAISFELNQKNAIILPQEYRTTHRHYWFD
jgi:competence protein ComEC